MPPRSKKVCDSLLDQQNGEISPRGHSLQRLLHKCWLCEIKCSSYAFAQQNHHRICLRSHNHGGRQEIKNVRFAITDIDCLVNNTLMAEKWMKSHSSVEYCLTVSHYLPNIPHWHDNLWCQSAKLSSYLTMHLSSLGAGGNCLTGFPLLMPLKTFVDDFYHFNQVAVSTVIVYIRAHSCIIPSHPHFMSSYLP